MAVARYRSIQMPPDLILPSKSNSVANAKEAVATLAARVSSCAVPKGKRLGSYIVFPFEFTILELAGLLQVQVLPSPL